MPSTHIDKINYINDLLLEIASGNLDIRAKLSKDLDEWDGLYTSINLLAEELEYTTVSKNHLESIYKGIPDMLVIVNRKLKIIDTNDIVTNELGYTKEVLIHSKIEDYIEDLPFKTIQEIQNNIESNGFSHNFRLNIINSNNKYIPCLCSTAVVNKDSLIDRFYIIIIKNISQILKNEQQLKKRNQDLSDFLYRLSHDFKSPLTNIKGFSKLGLEESKNKELQKYFQLIINSSQQIEVLIEKIKELNVIFNQTEEKYSDNINIEQYFKSVFRNQISNKGITDIELKTISDQQYEYYTNENFWNIIVSNLFHLSKHLQNNQEPLIIIVVIKEDKDFFFINYIDNGLGINSMIVDKAFNLFIKSGSNKNLTGLELYSIREYTEKLGGDVIIEPGNYNGLNLRFTFPKNKKYTIND
jgi:PAS domain S-box-containing protein